MSYSISPQGTGFKDSTLATASPVKQAPAQLKETSTPQQKMQAVDWKRVGIIGSTVAGLMLVARMFYVRNPNIFEDVVAQKIESLEKKVKTLQENITKKEEALQKAVSENATPAQSEADSMTGVWVDPSEEKGFWDWIKFPPNINRSFIPRDFKEKKVYFSSKEGIYKIHGKKQIIEPSTEAITGAIFNSIHSEKFNFTKALAKISQDYNVQIVKKDNYLIVQNEAGIETIVPMMIHDDISHKQMKHLVKEGLFVLPEGNRYYFWYERFSIPAGGFPMQVSENAQLPGFLVPNN